jgi:alkylated DNA repair dioxygenase AlkB
MEQLNIFGGASRQVLLPANLMEYFPAVFDAMGSTAIINRLATGIAWEQKAITMYGKQMLMPRLMAWYGDAGSSYAFSGTTYIPRPWTQELIAIKQIVDSLAGVTFNSVLLNYYRNGNDSMSWHSDDERELGTNPIIASVSFGQMRRFDIRHKNDHQNKYSVDLENGSVLLMKGDMQHHWEHRIAKSTRPMKERVNLTFRVIHQ